MEIKKYLIAIYDDWLFKSLECAKTNTLYETDSIFAVLAGAGVADMPVDPYEPKYCFCNQVSFGKMIECDNPGVNIFISICLSFVS